ESTASVASSASSSSASSEETNSSENSDQNAAAIDLAQQAAQAAQQAAEAAQHTVEQVQQATNITSVASIADINVVYGTAISLVNLPATLNVTLSDSTNQTVSVAWDNGMPNYDSNLAGTYIFTGTLTFSGSITNINNIKAVANVIVAPVSSPENPSSATQEIIQNATSDFLIGTQNFINWIFGTTTKAVSSAPIVRKVGAGLINSLESFKSILYSSDIKSLGAGLFDPIKKMFGALGR
ncbi:MAG: Ig-like domain-containing protein, partial [Candidatus Staskawiczbacteria bacterium]|nr:Ig-like domain-containing protein [Candidatus Staskawiczbacteria bacterium]